LGAQYKEELTLRERISAASTPAKSATVPITMAVALRQENLLQSISASASASPLQPLLEYIPDGEHILGIMQNLPPSHQREEPKYLWLDLQWDIHFLYPGPVLFTHSSLPLTPSGTAWDEDRLYIPAAQNTLPLAPHLEAILVS
jgi:hypothetical protein